MKHSKQPSLFSLTSALTESRMQFTAVSFKVNYVLILIGFGVSLCMSLISFSGASAIIKPAGK